jgi:hypothetical protein
MYLIEMDNSKNPPESSYGSRDLLTSNQDSQHVSLKSIYNMSSAYNGHMNRNIRTQLALIDAAKPYVSILTVVLLSKNNVLEVTFKINGCSQIN